MRTQNTFQKESNGLNFFKFFKNFLLRVLQLLSTMKDWIKNFIPELLNKMMISDWMIWE